MISKLVRFHGRHSLNRVYRQGKIERSKTITLRHGVNNKNHYRAAVVVSRKVHKSAVVRNRIRRRIYEIIRLYDKSHSLPPLDLIFSIYDESIAVQEHDRLLALVAGLLDKATKSQQKSAR